MWRGLPTYQRRGNDICQVPFSDVNTTLSHLAITSWTRCVNSAALRSHRCRELSTAPNSLTSLAPQPCEARRLLRVAEPPRDALRRAMPAPAFVLAVRCVHQQGIRRPALPPPPRLASEDCRCWPSPTKRRHWRIPRCFISRTDRSATITLRPAGHADTYRRERPVSGCFPLKKPARNELRRENAKQLGGAWAGSPPYLRACRGYSTSYRFRKNRAFRLTRPAL